MKKIKYLFLLTIIFSLTGCFNKSSMEDISIVTSVYPIEFVVNSLYGQRSNITSLYPNDSDITNFEITDVLLEQYDNNELFIFNGLTDEKEYLKVLRSNNKDLKIIDATTDMKIDYSIEELWLDPNNLLTIANNIRKGFSEYIDSTYLTNEINENYENLKVELTNLDGSFYSTVKNSNNNTIIVSDNAFSYLKKYDITVISLDPDTLTAKDKNEAIKLLKNNTCKYIFIKYGEEVSDELKDIIDESGAETLELFTMTDLHDINLENSNYIKLMNQNLDKLKLELYKK